MPATPARSPATPAVLGGAALLGFFALTFVVVLRGEALSAEMVSSLLQTINNLTLLAAGFLWGSSNETRIRDETIHAQANAATPGPLGTAAAPLHVEASIDPEPTP